MGSQDQSSFSMKVLAVLSVLAAACSANLPVPGSIPGLSIDQQYQYILQLQDHLNQQVQWNGRRKRSLPVPGTTGLVQDLQLKLNGMLKILPKLPLIMEGRKEVFQFQELSLGLFQDLLVKLNGTKHNWLPLQEERKEVFQFQELSLGLFQDLLVKLSGTKPNWLPLHLL